MATLLFFGKLGDLAGGDERDFPLAEAMPIATLIDSLGKDEPALAEALCGDRVKVALDGTIVSTSAMVGPDSEIAFLPPVSGG